jgi:hypothetical protein
VGATDRPRPCSIKTAKKSLGPRALPLRSKEREPEQLPGPLRPKTRGARIRKDGPPTAKEEALGPHDDGAAFLGGGRLQGSPADVCLRWSEPERHEKEEAFVVVAYDHSGIDALLSRLLEERPEL